MAAPALTVKHGALCTPAGKLLMHQYPGGDVDRFEWPLPSDGPWRHRLAVALYDEAECESWLGTWRAVTLPDGEVFGIEANIDPEESRRERQARADW